MEISKFGKFVNFKSWHILKLSKFNTLNIRQFPNLKNLEILQVQNFGNVKMLKNVEISTVPKFFTWEILKSIKIDLSIPLPHYPFYPWICPNYSRRVFINGTEAINVIESFMASVAFVSLSLRQWHFITVDPSPLSSLELCRFKIHIWISRWEKIVENGMTRHLMLIGWLFLTGLVIENVFY